MRTPEQLADELLEKVEELASSFAPCRCEHARFDHDDFGCNLCGCTVFDEKPKRTPDIKQLLRADLVKHFTDAAGKAG